MSPRHTSVTPLHPLGEGDRFGRPGLDGVQGTLALDLGRTATPPTPPPPRVPGRRGSMRIVSPRPAPAPNQPGGVDAQVRRDLDRWSRRYAQAAVEVVNGDRSASQLLRWTEPEIFADLTRRAQLVARAAGRGADEGQGRRPGIRPVVRTAHVCFLAPEIAEVAVRIQYGSRSRALAMRFERTLAVTRDLPLRPRWVCTALDFS